MIIETVTAIYHLEEEQGVLYRFPREESENPVDHDVAELRRDALPIPYEAVGTLRVGQPAQFLLRIRDDGVRTIRTTTPIVSINGRDE
jgi:hypothetical protein